MAVLYRFRFYSYYRLQGYRNWTGLVGVVWSDRNQLEGEILVACVGNEDYLKQIKDRTLSGQWKRIPFFFTPVRARTLIKSFDKWGDIDIIGPYSVTQESRFMAVTAAWFDGARAAITSQYGTVKAINEQMIPGAEISILKRIRRHGEIEKLHRYLLTNIDDPFSFVDEYVQNLSNEYARKQ